LVVLAGTNLFVKIKLSVTLSDWNYQTPGLIQAYFYIFTKLSIFKRQTEHRLSIKLVFSRLPQIDALDLVRLRYSAGSITKRFIK
jgi:hypothetical protein